MGCCQQKHSTIHEMSYSPEIFIREGLSKESEEVIPAGIKEILNEKNKLFRSINSQGKRSLLFESIKLYFSKMIDALQKERESYSRWDQAETTKVKKQINHLEGFINQLSTLNEGEHAKYTGRVTEITKELEITVTNGLETDLMSFEEAVSCVKEYDEKIFYLRGSSEMPVPFKFLSILAEYFWVSNFGRRRYVELDRDIIIKLKPFLEKTLGTSKFTVGFLFSLFDSANMSIKDMDIDKFFTVKVWDPEAQFSHFNERMRKIGGQKLILCSLPSKETMQTQISVTLINTFDKINEICTPHEQKKSITEGAFIFGEDSKDNSISLPDITYPPANKSPTASSLLSSNELRGYQHENFFKVYLFSPIPNEIRPVFCVSDMCSRSYSKILVEKKIPVALVTDIILEIGNKGELFTVTVGRKAPSNPTLSDKGSFFWNDSKALKLNFQGLLDEEEKEEFDGVKLRNIATGQTITVNTHVEKYSLLYERETNKYKVDSFMVTHTNSSSLIATLEYMSEAWTIRGSSDFKAEKSEKFPGPYILFRTRSELKQDFPSAPLALAEGMHFQSAGVVFIVKKLAS